MKVTGKHLNEIVAPVSDVLQNSLEYGVSKAHEYLDNRIFDPWLYANLTRYHARQRIAHETLPDSPWRLEPQVPNSGIHLSISGGHKIHIYSGSRSHMPSPGHSFTRMTFWSDGAKHFPRTGQMFMQFEERGDEVDSRRQPLNILALYKVNPNDLSVNVLLAHPVGTWKYQARPRCSAVVTMFTMTDPVNAVFVPKVEDEYTLVTPEFEGEFYEVEVNDLDGI